jgi:hypothetical protein
MDTVNLVRASADVVRVTTLRVGDCYKRLEPANYGSTELKGIYGVVQTVDFDGENAMVTSIELDVAHYSAEPRLKTFGTGQDLKIFAAAPDEIAVHMDETRKAMQRQIDTAQRSLADALNKRELIEKVFGQLTGRELSYPQVTDQPAPAAELPAPVDRDPAF